MFNMRPSWNTAQVKSVVQLLSNTLQHVLGNSLQCGSESLFEFLYICKNMRGGGDTDKAPLK